MASSQAHGRDRVKGRLVHLQTPVIDHAVAGHVHSVVLRPSHQPLVLFLLAARGQTVRVAQRILHIGTEHIAVPLTAQAPSASWK